MREELACLDRLNELLTEALKQYSRTRYGLPVPFAPIDAMLLRMDLEKAQLRAERIREQLRFEAKFAERLATPVP